MSRFNPARDISAIYDAAATWRDQCLLADGSVFASGEGLWTGPFLDEIADADVATVVAREKTRLGKDMVIFAGARFAQTALAAGVVDELSLLVIPELFGHGTRLFEGHVLRRKLALVEARVMDTGAVLQRYRVEVL